MNKDLEELYSISMSLLLQQVSDKQRASCFTQKEFEDNYAIIMKLSKLKSNINKKLNDV